MNQEKTGQLIRRLRIERGLTQLELANQLMITDKTVSKWERGLGLPDVSLLPGLAQALGVRLEQLLEGDMNENDRQGGNMKRTKFYICPHCGNVLTASAEAQISCCGKNLIPLEAKKADDTHRLTVELIENEYYLTAAHPQTREHSLAFAALLTGDTVILRRLYPEWDVQTRIPRLGHGQLYFYCTQDGLFVQNL